MIRCLACSYWTPWSSWWTRERRRQAVALLQGWYRHSPRRPEFWFSPCQDDADFSGDSLPEPGFILSE